MREVQVIVKPTIQKLIRKMPKESDVSCKRMSDILGVEASNLSKLFGELCACGICERTGWGRYQYTKKGVKLVNSIQGAWKEFISWE